MRAAPISEVRAVYEIASYTIESHGEHAGDVPKEFVAANQSEEAIKTRALWADVVIAVRALTSDPRDQHTAATRSRLSGDSAA
jgi:hypothetical protein